MLLNGGNGGPGQDGGDGSDGADGKDASMMPVDDRYDGSVTKSVPYTFFEKSWNEKIMAVGKTFATFTA